MIEPNILKSSLQEAISENIRLLAEGHERFRVFTPFMFDDGDHFCIVAKRKNNEWIFTDEGHTFMHLSYDIKTQSLNSGTRAKIIENVLSNFGISEKNGALLCEFNKDNIGAMFFSYVQALCKISDINYLTQERIISTFNDDVNNFLSEFVPQERIYPKYCDIKIDPHGHYPIDYKINGMESPLHVFVINSDDKCRNATISIHHFEKNKFLFNSLGIFEDQEKMNRRALAQFTDVCDRQFASLYANRPKIKKHISKML